MMSPRIFISYSRRDKAVADYIGAELRNRGADVFIDYQKLIAGENFIGRLGREIETRDFFVLLLSPRSVGSKWVQAEAAWALRCEKPIIPVVLEPASMTDFFFLATAEYVDFARWSVDGNVGEAVRKLAAALGLPAEPIRAEPTPELLVKATPPEEEAEDKLEATSAPAFARGDLSELFLTAAEVAHQDPEQAIFLYRRILEIDPEYMQGKAQAFVQREEQRLRPARLARMLAQAEAAMKAGQWRRAERIGRDMLTLDRKNADANRIVDICVKNAECEPIYQKAIIAAQAGRWSAVATLTRDIRETCPDYGDPAGLLAIRVESAGFLCELTTLTSHSDEVYYVAFSPDGSLLASEPIRDKTIKLWKMPGGRELATFPGHSKTVNSVAFSPDGSLLASASDDKTIKLWQITDRRELATLTGHNEAVHSVAFSPDSSLLASASDDKTIKLWEMPSGRIRATIKGHGMFEYSKAAFSPDGSLLACIPSDKTIKLVETSHGRELVTLTGHHGESVSSVAFSPDGSLLVFESGTETINVWEVSSERVLATIKGHRNDVVSVAFSPDGSLLASASIDETIKLWKMPNGRELATLTGHSNEVYCVAFAPNGSLLASGSADNTIKLWEMPGGRELATLTGLNGSVLDLTFSPDGSLLASALGDNTVKLWGLG